MYADNYDSNPPGIMSLFTESRIGKTFAQFMTVIVAITIFGSTYSMLCGMGYLPYAAAKDGVFFSTFAHESTSHPGLADRSLILVVLLTIPWCFFSLDVVIDAMTTCLVLVQFVGQGAGLLYFRWRTPKSKQPSGWRMALFPMPVLIQIAIFFFIWVTTDSVFLWGSDDPILEMAAAFLALGPIVFLIRSRRRKEWPFNATEPKESSFTPVVVAPDAPPGIKMEQDVSVFSGDDDSQASSKGLQWPIESTSALPGTAATVRLPASAQKAETATKVIHWI